jgi:hypothetical protein
LSTGAGAGEVGGGVWEGGSRMEGRGRERQRVAGERGEGGQRRRERQIGERGRRKTEGQGGRERERQREMASQGMKGRHHLDAMPTPRRGKLHAWFEGVRSVICQNLPQEGGGELHLHAPVARLPLVVLPVLRRLVVVLVHHFSQ